MRQSVDLQHLPAKVVQDLDRRLGEAKQRVAKDECLTLAVGLSLKVGRDKDGELVVSCDEKDGGSRKSSWDFNGQPELPFDDDTRRTSTVTLAGRAN